MSFFQFNSYLVFRLLIKFVHVHFCPQNLREIGFSVFMKSEEYYTYLFGLRHKLLQYFDHIPHFLTLRQVDLHLLDALIC